MVQLAQAFDVRQVRPADPDGGQSFPVGHHKVIISKTDWAKTKDGTGTMLVLTLKAIEGPASGMEAAYRLNLYNNNQDAVRIAYEQLSAIGHVTGVYNVQETDHLLNKPFIAVVVSQNDPKYPNGTQIRGVLDMNGDKPGQPGVKGAPPQTAQQQQPDQGAAPAPAWQPPAAAPGGPAPGQWGPSSAPPPQQQQPQYQQPPQQQQPQANPPGFAPFNPAQANPQPPAAPPANPFPPQQQPQQPQPGYTPPQGFQQPQGQPPQGQPGQPPAWAAR